jgi:acetyl esterase/lipase
MKRYYTGVCTACIFLMIAISSIQCQSADEEVNPAAPLTQELAAASDLTGHYRVTPNIVYVTAENYAAKLDIYKSSGSGLKATLVYIHGGGWRGGPSKEEYSLWFEPFLFLGWNVVNVEYRPSTVASAPAAVQDCVCALRWVIRNAKKYDFDTNRIVIMGHSAGGHLALMSGIAPAAGFDQECPGNEPLKVAAIVDWFGITDVSDLIHGVNTRTFAQQWIGSLPDPQTRAKRVSPLTYVRSGLPPTIIVHGDKDPKVPYSQAVRLHTVLTAAGVPNQLLTIPGGGHGGFGNDQTRKAYAQIFEFLRRNGVGTQAVR